MSELIKDNPWVWVIVLGMEGNEQFFGRHDDEKNTSYIPAFLEKEEATECLELFARDIEKKHEIQAIRYDELAEDAAKNGFMIYILSRSGEVLEKIQT